MENVLKKNTYLYPEKIVESEAKVYLSNFCNNSKLGAKQMYNCRGLLEVWQSKYQIIKQPLKTMLLKLKYDDIILSKK